MVFESDPKVLGHNYGFLGPNVYQNSVFSLSDIESYDLYDIAYILISIIDSYSAVLFFI